MLITWSAAPAAESKLLIAPSAVRSVPLAVLKAPVTAAIVVRDSVNAFSTATAIGSSLSVKSEICPVALATDFEMLEKSDSAVSNAPDACSTLARIAATLSWFSLPTRPWNSFTSLIASARRSGASSVSDCTTERCPWITGTPWTASRSSGFAGSPGLSETSETPVTPWAWSWAVAPWWIGVSAATSTRTRTRPEFFSSISSETTCPTERPLKVTSAARLRPETLSKSTS